MVDMAIIGKHDTCPARMCINALSVQQSLPALAQELNTVAVSGVYHYHQSNKKKWKVWFEMTKAELVSILLERYNESYDLCQRFSPGEAEFEYHYGVYTALAAVINMIEKMDF
jgi:hypothetical protein